MVSCVFIKQEAANADYVSYLSDVDLPQGVPQGCCLVSLLFDVVESHLPNVHAYADDMQLKISHLSQMLLLPRWMLLTIYKLASWT